MATQTRNWQRKILTEAQRDNYAGLYWWIEASWGAGKHQSPVGYPGNWLPLVPVAPDPDASRRIAGMLAYLLKLALPDCAGHSFEVALTHDDALKETGAKWYVWTNDVSLDAICSDCGAVEVVAHTLVEVDSDNLTWICENCIRRLLMAHPRPYAPGRTYGHATQYVINYLHQHKEATAREIALSGDKPRAVGQVSRILHRYPELFEEVGEAPDGRMVWALT